MRDSPTHKTRRGVVPTEQDRAAARHLLDELGEAGARQRTGISELTIQRIAAGSTVRLANLIALRAATGRPLLEGA